VRWGATDDTILAFWYRHERAARSYDGAMGRGPVRIPRPGGPHPASAAT
jgi:hypothetical protein